MTGKPEPGTLVQGDPHFARFHGPSIPSAFRQYPPDDPIPLPGQDAEIKALRSFWRGYVLGLLTAGAFIAGAMWW